MMGINRKLISALLLTVVLLVLSTWAVAASEIIYYNSSYGWKINVPPEISIDDSLAPETVCFILDDGGEVRIESGLPEVYFWDTGTAWDSMKRIMSFVVDKLERESVERGETTTGVAYEDMFFRGYSGSEGIEGFIRLYLGPEGVALSYSDKPSIFFHNLDKVRALADTFYYPPLGEVLTEGDYELKEFTNRSYGYRVMYPEVFKHDEVWAFLSFYFLGEPVIDVYYDGWNGATPEELIGKARELVLEDFAEYKYSILSESNGANDEGIQYLDLTLSDNEEDRWLKRIRIFALPDATVRFQFYCPAGKFDEYGKALDTIVESFSYDPAWIDKGVGGPDTPLGELYASGDFDWVEYHDRDFDYRLTVPDFIEVESTDGLTFFNYGFRTVIAAVAGYFPGLSPDEAVAASEKEAIEEFGTRWQFRRYGDISGSTEEGWPYIDFRLDDNDPDVNYIKRIRVIGVNGMAVRIEMYDSPVNIEELSPFFDEVAESFSFEINLITGDTGWSFPTANRTGL